MIFKRKPKDFNCDFEIVSCYFEYNKKILLLLRQDYKPQGNKWGLPAGKKEDKDINISAAMIREAREETSVQINKENLTFKGKLYIKHTNLDFIYYMFHTNFESKPDIHINQNEHKNFKWLTPNEAIQNLNLVEDLDRCIKLVYKLKIK